MPKPMNLVGSVGRTILLVCLFAVLPAGCKLETQRMAAGTLLFIFEDDSEEDNTQSEQDYQAFTFDANRQSLDGIKRKHELDVTDNKLDMYVLPRADKGYIFGSWAKGGLYGGSTDPVVSVSTGFGVGPAWQDYFKNSQDIVTIKARYRTDPRREPASICEPRIAVFPGYETTTNSTVDLGGNQLNVSNQRSYWNFRKTGDPGIAVAERMLESIKDSNDRALGIRQSERDLRLTVYTSNAQKATGLAIKSERIDTTFADGQRQTVLWDYSGNPLVTLPTQLDLDNNVYEQTINARRYAGDFVGGIAQELLEEVEVKTSTEYQGWTQRNANGEPTTACLFVTKRTETEGDGTQTVFTSRSWVSSVDTVAGITVASQNSSSQGGSEDVEVKETEIVPILPGSTVRFGVKFRFD